jgi:hypothetical protein
MRYVETIVTIKTHDHFSEFSIFTEFSGAVKGLFFNKDYETAKSAVIEKYRPKLEQMAKFVG